MEPIVWSPETWTWPEDVAQRMRARGEVVPAPKPAPEPELETVYDATTGLMVVRPKGQA